MESRTLRLGKTAPIIDSRTLTLASYLTPALPAPPESVDWSKKVKQWPMYMNDKWGDCTCAAAGHMIEIWTANGSTPKTPTDAAILKLYEYFTTPGPENGCAMMDILRRWRSAGVGGDKIMAFALLERRNVIEMKDAVSVFGGCYIGVTLPKFAIDVPDISTVSWSMRPYGIKGEGAPDPDGGHCVCAVGYDARNLYVVTWGMIKAMSWEFYKAYSDEAYAVLSADFTSKRKAPNGFDLAQLQADILEVGNVPASRAAISVLHG